MLEGDDPREALEGFRQVVAMEQDKGEWCELLFTSSSINRL